MEKWKKNWNLKKLKKHEAQWNTKFNVFSGELLFGENPLVFGAFKLSMDRDRLRGFFAEKSRFSLKSWKLRNRVSPKSTARCSKLLVSDGLWKFKRFECKSSVIKLLVLEVLLLVLELLLLVLLLFQSNCQQAQIWAKKKEKKLLIV